MYTSPHFVSNMLILNTLMLACNAFIQQRKRHKCRFCSVTAELLSFFLRSSELKVEIKIFVYVTIIVNYE